MNSGGNHESNQTSEWSFTRVPSWTTKVQRVPTLEERIPPTSLAPCTPSSSQEIVSAIGKCHPSNKIHIEFTPQQYLTSMWGKSKTFGNALSPYWMGRALAFLAGVPFRCESPRGHWFAYLPGQVPAPPQGGCADKLVPACKACSYAPENWLYSHRCAPFAIAYIWQDIVRDTRAALQRYMAENPDLSLPDYRPDDVVIHDRCDRSTFLLNAEYGSPAFSFFNTIPTDVRRIFMVSNPKPVLNTPKCTMKNATIYNFLRSRHPRAEIIYAGSSDPTEDFAKLVYAPTLYINPSTFSFWAALANNGTAIHSIPTYGFPFYVPNWHWSSAPVVMGNINNDERFIHHPNFTAANTNIKDWDYDTKTIQLVLDYLVSH